MNIQADSITVDEISSLLLQILQSYKASTVNVTNEKLLTVEQVCSLTGFSERIYS